MIVVGHNLDVRVRRVSDGRAEVVSDPFVHGVRPPAQRVEVLKREHAVQRFIPRRDAIEVDVVSLVSVEKPGKGENKLNKHKPDIFIKLPNYCTKQKQTFSTDTVKVSVALQYIRKVVVTKNDVMLT